jgi:hypothetical protein
MNIENGKSFMKEQSVAICSIVRDCKKHLKRNIIDLENMRRYFKKTNVYIFENDSKDGTKDLLKQWRDKSTNTYIYLNDYDDITIPSESEVMENRYYSNHRISRMCKYRNEYLDKINQSKEKYDYIIILDLDIEKLNIKGIIDSFSLANYWDVICANGYSYSPSLHKRYHDSYALVELSKEKIPQTEESIRLNQSIWGRIKSGGPLIPVYSAYGGLAIYRYEAIKNKYYKVVPNEDKRVAVRCEHFSLCQQIRQAGYTRIFVNPSMILKYQSINITLVSKYIKNKL